jgi:ATP-dependent helicase/DNAse subunit B
MVQRLDWLVMLDFSENTPLRLQGQQHAESHPVAATITGQDRVPYWQEAGFGLSHQPPFELDGPAGNLKVRGVIDRMDRVGDTIVVMDYKSGTTQHPVKDMIAGRDFQMLVYLLATRDLVARVDPSMRVIGGLFWHIRNRQISGEILITDPALEEALNHLHQNVLAAREGWFGVQPNQAHGGPCSAHCEFRALCRYSPKGRQI